MKKSASGRKMSVGLLRLGVWIGDSNAELEVRIDGSERDSGCGEYECQMFESRLCYKLRESRMHGMCVSMGTAKGCWRV